MNTLVRVDHDSLRRAVMGWDLDRLFAWEDAGAPSDVYGDDLAHFIPRLSEAMGAHNVTVQMGHHFQVDYRELAGLDNEPMGMYDHQERLIAITPQCSPNQEFRCLVHEATHALGARHNGVDTNECTAESTAFLVCKELGVDVSAFSIPYIVGYKFGGGLYDTDGIEKYTNQILNLL